MRVRFTSLIMLIAFLDRGLGFAQAHDHASPEHLGTVTFSISCNKAAQPQINRAVALMHSFEFAHAIEAFNSILVSDPTCAIAYWGMALSSWGNPFAAGLKGVHQGYRAIDLRLRCFIARDAEGH